MSKATHEPEVYATLAEQGKNNQQIAEALGVGEASVRRGLSKAKALGLLSPPLVVQDDFLDEPIRHYGPIAVTADWHIPLVDYIFANRFLQHAKAEGHTTLAIAGDFFNHDALSAFDYKQESANLEKELTHAQYVMEKLLGQFEKIIFVWGNHDARFHKALQYKVSFSHAMRMCFGELGEEALGRIEFSNLDHFWVAEDDLEVNLTYVCHPKNYTAVPLSTARKLAAKVQANVITAHSHHAAMGYDVSGMFTCVEAGGLFDASKTAYLQRTTTFPTWKQGYSLIDEEGHIGMYTPHWSCR